MVFFVSSLLTFTTFFAPLGILSINFFIVHVVNQKNIPKDVPVIWNSVF